MRGILGPPHTVKVPILSRISRSRSGPSSCRQSSISTMFKPLHSSYADFQFRALAAFRNLAFGGIRLITHPTDVCRSQHLGWLNRIGGEVLSATAPRTNFDPPSWSHPATPRAQFSLKLR